MNVCFEAIVAEALALPERERAALAHRLIASLNEDAGEDSVELAWEAEIQRRLDAYRRGEAETVPSLEVFAKARALLK